MDNKTKLIIDEVISLTGLPEETLKKDLLYFAFQNKMSPSPSSLDELREVMSVYLMDVFSKVVEHEKSIS